ncbi:hypothetical protein Nepgr_030804 [Nepenthes gracilis]|uniref:Uncharacterized protein n=1 Tax=Nepenthes gracilis TaxID=150966 RepID=A0AAD3TGX6_NEPGR|nr:hypothetical protein Nepgr_030804 [Nepenthes gracilis]
MVRFASLPVTDISIHYWAIPTYLLTNCTNWWVDPGSSDLGMYYREHPDYSHRHLNKHPVPFCFSIVDLFSEKEDPVQKKGFPFCTFPCLIRPETSFREIGFVAYSTVISKCIGCPARDRRNLWHEIFQLSLAICTPWFKVAGSPPCSFVKLPVVLALIAPTLRLSSTLERKDQTRRIEDRNRTLGKSTIYMGNEHAIKGLYFSCFADCSCSYCCFLCFLLLTTCLFLTATAFPLDILFSLSRAIKGNETAKPKRSPAGGECLPIPKPFRSSLFRGNQVWLPFRKPVCGYVDDNRPIRTFVCWNLLLSESF